MAFQKSACIEPMYSELPFLERFQAAKKDGFEFVELWNWTDKDLDAVTAAAEKARIGIFGFNRDADLSLIDPEHKEAYLTFLRRFVEAAKKVGARSVTIHSNGLGDGGVVINHYNELSDTKVLHYVRHLERVRQNCGGERNLHEPGAPECHHRSCGQLPPDHPHGGGDDPAHRFSETEGPLRRVPYAAERGQPLRQHPGLWRPVRPHPRGGRDGAT